MGRPGSKWVARADHRGDFDELVVDSWLHIERMDTREWWMGIGDWHVWVRLDRSGRPTVTMHREEPRAWGKGRRK